MWSALVGVYHSVNPRSFTNFLNNIKNQKYLRWTKQEGWCGWDVSVELRIKTLHKANFPWIRGYWTSEQSRYCVAGFSGRRSLDTLRYKLQTKWPHLSKRRWPLAPVENGEKIKWPLPSGCQTNVPEAIGIFSTRATCPAYLLMPAFLVLVWLNPV